MEQGTKLIVQNMIKKGFSDEAIADMTGLNLEKVIEIRTRMENAHQK